MTVPAKPTFCPHCHSHNFIKKGSRQNLRRRLPLYYCKACYKYFSAAEISKVTYPPRLIMQALTYYNLGHTQQQVSNLLAKHHRTRVKRRTVSEWINRYKDICTYSRLRRQALLLYQPDELIQAHTLHHRQTYDFNLHLAKLVLLKPQLTARTFNRLQDYLESIPTDEFPHHLFQTIEDRPPHQPDKPTQRSSKIKLDTLEFVQTEKQNLANDLATLGLILARTNRQHHPKIQEFMLINDSSTVACEVPVYLTREHLQYFQTHGFHVSLPEISSPITGHIDIIQVRNAWCTFWTTSQRPKKSSRKIN